jgi:uncharacterized protein with NRDE domain
VCTLVFAWQVFPDAPVVAAANRDEQLDRPSEPPGLLESDPRVVAPRDAEAGGTWIGYNEHGVFAALTTRWDPAGERSRGMLVREVLRHRSAEDAARHVEREVTDRAYAGFDLVVADAAAAVSVEWDGVLSVRNFQPGVHVVVTPGADGDVRFPEERAEAASGQAEHARALSAALAVEPGESADDWLDRAGEALGDHEYGACVHREGENLGTRSSSLLAIPTAGVARYEFADGPPCRTDHEPVSTLARREEQV